ncbi:hypothetical protein SLS63_007272 [Diaporthe eres]|uniref:2EXR domain-containing protein n=1 Tax=Diaporthe eres TaxID=83184 RepID=A0ABR1P5X0_DIAER
MSGQTNNTVSSDLDKCVKVAEMSSFKLVNDAFQPDPNPYYKRVKTQEQIAKEGFPKFRELPPELRLKVWEYAMPPYGFFTALMYGREEPIPQQPPPPAPMVFRLVYRLEPVPRDQQGDELRMRLDTMRAIQRTNSEAASEVQRAFPTTINCTGGKLRFNAEHDTLSLSNQQCKFALGFTLRFRRYSQGAMVFADNWHKIPRKMVFNSTRMWAALSWLTAWPIPQYSEGFMEFLADCTGLKNFGFLYDKACHDSIPEDLGWELFDYEGLRFCSPASIMEDSFYSTHEPIVLPGELRVLRGSLQNLETIALRSKTGRRGRGK